MSLADAAEAAKKDTRRYAKRQLTWFRNQMPGWTWVGPDVTVDKILAPIKA
jgi:tRNA dimethylallyltransferase